jgi:Arc/MetJ-type ribon-helix-helix transcriptional regulator
MPSREPTTIQLSPEVNELLRVAMESGEFASPDEAIREGLYALDPLGTDIQRWLREEVVPYALELERDPSQLLTVEQVDAALAEERKRFLRGE